MIRSSAFLLSIVFLTSCVNDKEEGPLVTDASLFELSQSVSSFSYYKNTLDTLPADPSSEHFNFVRVRFNPTAKQAMDDSTKALVAGSFPDGSMIVKEIYATSGGPLTQLAIMYKLKNAANNGSGWVWSTLQPDGASIYSSSEKGGLCVGCHSSGVHSDLVQTFALH